MTSHSGLKNGVIKMNRNILIVLGGAVLAALLVAMLVQVTLGGKKVKTDDSGAAVEILVAAKDLKASHELEEGDLKWVEWPEEKIISGTIIRKPDQEPMDALEGRLARDVSQGEPMKRSAMLKAKTGNFVAASLAPGERAVSIKVKPETMVAGFIGPGSFVDVILTYKQKIKAGKGDDPRIQTMIDLNLVTFATETVIQNARVLALDQTVERDFDDDVKTSKTVTLAVPYRDAEKLALADKMGTLVLSLRGVGDTTVAEKLPTITDARMTTIGDEVYEEYTKMKQEKNVNVENEVVRVYNGAAVVTRQLK